MVDSNKYTPNPRQYYKSNFVELLELLTPSMYAQDDQDLSGTEVNPISLVINGHIEAASNINGVLSLSAVPNSQTSNLSSIEGISQYFVKQNELTKVMGTKVDSVIDTTGAGDMFAAGFIFKYINGYDPKESVEFANKLASLIIQKFGARADSEMLNKIV